MPLMGSFYFSQEQLQIRFTSDSYARSHHIIWTHSAWLPVQITAWLRTPRGCFLSLSPPQTASWLPVLSGLAGLSRYLPHSTSSTVPLPPRGEPSPYTHFMLPAPLLLRLLSAALLEGVLCPHEGATTTYLCREVVCHLESSLYPPHPQRQRETGPRPTAVAVPPSPASCLPPSVSCCFQSP